MFRSNDVVPRLTRRMLTILIALTWAGALRGDVPLNDPPAAPKQQPTDAALAELEKAFAVVDAALRDLPRDTFDPQAVIEQVGRDPQKLFEWVRDNTLWVPYQGALRGPVGVLMDRSGNSLDRAMLLAELLRGAGVEARLARATLTPEQAKSIVDSFRTSKPATIPPPPPPDKQAEMVAGYAKASGTDAAVLKGVAEKLAAQNADASKMVASRTDALAPAVLKAVPAGSVASEDDRLLAAASDHWWAQWRSGQTWEDLDPALASPATAQSNVAWKGGGSELRIDAKLCHEIGVTVIVERWENGKLIETPALITAIRPAETFGRNVAFTHVGTSPADRPGRRDAASLKKQMLAQREWVPVLAIGKTQVVQASFDDAGVVNDKPSFDPTGKVAAAAQKTFGGFGAALGGGDDAKKTSSVLTAEWVQYEIRSPGNEPYTIRREIFDLLGPAVRSGAVPMSLDVPDAKRLDRAMVLACQLDMLPLASRLSPEYVGYLAARALLDSRAALLQVMRTQNPTDGQKDFVFEKLNQAPGVLHGLALARHASPDLRDAVFLDRPNLLNYRGHLRLDESDKLFLRETLDVVANHVAVRPGAGDAYAVRVRQGVADTAAEAAVSGGGGGAPATLDNTTEIFAKASEAGIATRAVRSPEDLKVIRLEPDARARVAATLAQGYVVVVPQSGIAAPGGERSGWWRVDPKTGETIGVMDSGFHQETTEDAIIRIINNMLSMRNVRVADQAFFRGMRYQAFARYVGIPMSPGLHYIYAMIRETGFFG